MVVFVVFHVFPRSNHHQMVVTIASAGQATQVGTLTHSLAWVLQESLVLNLNCCWFSVDPLNQFWDLSYCKSKPDSWVKQSWCGWDHDSWIFISGEISWFLAREFLHLAVNRRLISKFGRWISQICLVVVIPKFSWQIASWYLYDHTMENLHTQQWPFPELHLDQRVGGKRCFRSLSMLGIIIVTGNLSCYHVSNDSCILCCTLRANICVTYFFRVTQSIGKQTTLDPCTYRVPHLGI